MTLKKLSAGAGFECVIRQVAAPDPTELGRTKLGDYYFPPVNRSQPSGRSPRRKATQAHGASDAEARKLLAAARAASG